jgi:hypothetical protein
MLAAGMNKKRRTYQPRIVGGQVICRSKAPSLERMGPVFDREDLTLLDHHFMSGVAQPAFMSTRANSRYGLFIGMVHLRQSLRRHPRTGSVRIR